MKETQSKLEMLNIQNRAGEAGVTLMEMIAALSVIAVITIGSLALYNAATSSQSSTQLVQDVTAVRAAVKQLWLGQGTYGVAGTSLDATLIASRRLPTTLRVNGGQLFHVLNDTLAVVAQGNLFDMTLQGITPDVCLTLLTNTAGWVELQVGANPAINAFPIVPATAVAQCGAAPVTIRFRSA